MKTYCESKFDGKFKAFFEVGSSGSCGSALSQSEEGDLLEEQEKYEEDEPTKKKTKAWKMAFKVKDFGKAFRKHLLDTPLT